ncbi:MAG TPA: response regulator [Chloroflexota bacterium]|nr:response regulator [Chloroflexota bacterium]
MRTPLPLVLVVDDDAAIRSTVCDILELEDFAVEQAANGEAALQVLSERAARGAPPPDAILLDMRMPVMDGWEFSRRYRTLPGPHAPIVVMTAARDANQWGREVGASATLGKPFGLQDLLDTVTALVRAPNPANPAKAA